MKYDVKEILVPPGDIEFILLKKRLQNFPPLKHYSCHVILKRRGGKKTATQEFIAIYVKKPTNLLFRQVSLFRKSFLHQ